MSQRLDHRRTVGLVLDELELNVGPVSAELADSEQSAGEIQSAADLVQDVSICSVGRVNLTDHKVGILCVFECHIPRLELLVKAAWQINRFAQLDGAIRHLHRDGWQVGTSWLPISPPMSLEHAAFGWRRSLLVLTRITVAPQGGFQGVQRR